MKDSQIGIPTILRNLKRMDYGLKIYVKKKRLMENSIRSRSRIWDNSSNSSKNGRISGARILFKTYFIVRV